MEGLPWCMCFVKFNFKFLSICSVLHRGPFCAIDGTFSLRVESRGPLETRPSPVRQVWRRKDDLEKKVWFYRDERKKQRNTIHGTKGPLD